MTNEPPAIRGYARSEVDDYFVETLSDPLRFACPRLHHIFGHLPVLVRFRVMAHEGISPRFHYQVMRDVVFLRDTACTEWFEDSICVLLQSSTMEVHARLWEGTFEDMFGTWVTFSESTYEYTYLHERTYPVPDPFNAPL